jgi:GTPase Era involved in 16S rRNA processing
LSIIAQIHRNFCVEERQIIFMDTPNHFKLETDFHLAIQELAKEVDRPVEQVNFIYDQTLTNLKSKARIQDFLHVLASKKVRDDLRN